MKLHLPLLVCLTFSVQASDLSRVGGGGGGDTPWIRTDRNRPGISGYSANYSRTLQVDRYRKLGDRYLDLQPLFTWMNYPPERRSKTGNPMPAWRTLAVKVSQVLPEGLLVHRYGGSDGGTAANAIFLRNFPGQQKMVDGKYISALAVQLPEPFRYKNVLGSVETVEQYDYGIPFDPQERVKQVAAEKANGLPAPAPEKKP
jgi:hypothetical protein